MKKFITTFVLAITFFPLQLPSKALAATCPDAPPPVSGTVNEINSYLNDNNAQGATNINDWMKKGMDEIKKSYPDAFLVEFGFDFNAGSSNGHYFQWMSPSEKTKIFEFGTDGSLEKITYDGAQKNGIFTVPMRMRDLTKAMLNDKKLLALLDSSFDECAIVDTSFKLTKNSNNSLMWYITFTDSVEKNVSYLVKVSAEKRQNPVFMVFENKTGM